MRSLIALALVLHGVAHFVGVRSALWPRSTRPARLLRIPPLVEGIAWSLLGLGFFAAAALFLWRSEASYRVVLAASGASLSMCALAWPDAKIGVIVDALLLVVTMLFSPTSTRGHLRAAFEHEVERAALSPVVVTNEIVEEAAISSLPAPVRRYLHFMGAPGRPRQLAVRSSFTGQFRRDEGEWLPCEVLQLDVRTPVTRVYVMQLSLRSLLPVTVRDTYVRGRGTLSAKAFDWLTVAEGSGHELDVGELVTYLNDALLLAPSLLLGASTTWAEVDADTFDVALTDGALRVSGRVWLDARGAPRMFSTTDRYFEERSGHLVRTEWRTPIDGWREVNGRNLPTRAQAVWQLPAGPFTYVRFDFDPTRIVFTPP